MVPVLLFAAVGLVMVALLFLAWRQIDRRIALAYADQDIEVVQRQLEEALARQKQLTTRVEHLEAIIVSEPWEAAQTQPASPRLNVDADSSPPGKPAKRHRTR